MTAGSTHRGRRLSRRRALAAGAVVLAARGLDNRIAGAQGSEIAMMLPQPGLTGFELYPYWVAAALGYFGGVGVAIGVADDSSLVAPADSVTGGRADVACAAPVSLAEANAQGSSLVSVFQLSATDALALAIQRGNPAGITSFGDLDGRVVAVLDASWRALIDPLIVHAGGDPATVTYEAVGEAWHQLLYDGYADAALCWEGLRATWRAQGFEFDYILGRDVSPFPGYSLQIRSADAENAEVDALYTNVLRGWAMGLEFGYHNPRAAAQITMETDGIGEALREVFGDRALAVEAVWQVARTYRGDWGSRNGWGWHDQEAWQRFVEAYAEVTPDGGELGDTEMFTNKYIEGANGYEAAAVQAEALAFELSPEFADVPEPEGAGADTEQ